VTVNPNWIRWLYASVADHLHTACAAVSLPLVVDFLDERSDDWMASANKAEASIAGPHFRQTSPTGFFATFGIFVVISSHKQTGDNYVHLDKAGAVAQALDQCIIVKDYGTNPTPVEITKAKPVANGENSVTHLRPSEIENLVHSTIEVEFTAQFTQ